MAWVLFLVPIILFGWIIVAINKDNNKPYERTFTTSIKVPAKWVSDDYGNGHQPRDGHAIFELGEGPCGLTVTSMYGDWSCDRRNFTVKQYCSDGSSKLFHYRREDITGRIEETFKKELVTL